MPNLNKIILMGNITKAPDVRTITNSETVVATTSLAVNRKYKEKEEVMFIDIVAYGRQAEIMGEYLTKGSSILVEGRLSYKQWEQDGQKHSKHEVIIEHLQLLSKKESSEKADSEINSQAEIYDKTTGEFKNDTNSKISEDDLPF